MNEAIDSAPLEQPAAATNGQWHALPRRARVLFAGSTALTLAIVFAAAGGTLGMLLERLQPGGSGALDLLLGASAGLLAGAVCGMWWGARRYRYTRWMHDTDGLAVRSGNLWRQETRVPASRVQHLDIKRGPWQRRRALSTLVVHTAGTRHGAVMVPNLDAGDAEHLREQLARQIDHDE